MSSANALADAGVQAVSAGKYSEGVEKLTKALKQRPAPLWHLERSKAYLRTNRFHLALYDAEMALHIAFERANREQMMQAQIRRAVTLFRMGRFADADVCAYWAIRLVDGAKARENDGQQNKVGPGGDYVVRMEEVQNEAKPLAGDALNTALQKASTRTKESSLRNQAFSWRIQALTQMEKLPAGHDGRKLHALVKYPEPSQMSATESTAPDSSTPTADGGAATGERSSSDAADVTAGRDVWEKLWSQYHSMHAKYKVRCSYYQTDTSLTVDIFLKNLSKEQVLVDPEAQAVKLNPVQGAALGGLNGPIVLLLFDEIKPEATKYNVKSMKIELVLQKQRAGKWPNLRRDKADIVDNLSINSSQGVPFSQFFDFVTTLGFKDTAELKLPDPSTDPSAWYTALLQQLRSSFDNRWAPSSATGVKYPAAPDPVLSSHDEMEIDTPTPQGGITAVPVYPTSSRKGPKNWDTIDIDDDGDKDAAKDGDVNDFFRQIYKNADPDTKRAMMKSFLESNGTSLSTSWADAKDKTYKTSPPDGVEAKKWE